MENLSQQDNGLEDRLRGLILANSDDGNQELPSLGVMQGNVRREFTDSPGTGTHKAAKKRPNQAQRRQMANEMTIPVDTRPEPVNPHRATGSGAGYGYGGPQQSLNYNQPAHRGTRQAYGHQSAEFQSLPRSPTVQNQSTGHQQHGQSSSQSVEDWRPSRSGPRLHNNPQNWRQGAYRNQSQGPRGQGPPGQGRQNNHRLYQPGVDVAQAQVAFLEKLAAGILFNAEISIDELMEKENFRLKLEQLCRSAVVEHELSVGVMIPPQTVELRCFGSLASGFATKAADMDLALVSPFSPLQPDAPGSPIPRLLEKAFLDLGIGARLLTRTRVPIIKVCESPSESLRNGLRAARLKWEAGEGEDIDGPDEEQPEEPRSPPADQQQPETSKVTGITAQSAPGLTLSDPPGADEMPLHTQQPPQQQQHSQSLVPGSTVENGHKQSNNDVVGEPDEDKQFLVRLAALKQQPNMSFDTYCAKAKRFIRDEGFADLAPSNAPTYLEVHRTKLSRVCRAFVEGLADQELKNRLFRYKSVSILPGYSRTLAGLITQIEGETLAMSWDKRPLKEKDRRQEAMAWGAVDDWVALQFDHETNTELDYQKKLHFACERLRNIPSLMILHLQQDEFESAAAYHRRATQLLIELGGNDIDPALSPKSLPVVIERYIAGIHNPQIRAAVASAYNSSTGTLRGIARRHKSLQLAHDFQRALDKGYYQGTEADVVRRYVAYLQGPLVKPRQSSQHYDCVIPKTKVIQDEILPVIQRLSNPSDLALNQPRDRYKDPLEFPKSGVGVQCDVNFSAHLALHNTALLRCYSYTDPRVKPMILFVKHWAKVRGINNPYRGTLSSYGYVLMVIHYLVNVVQPFVCPNLQLLAPPDTPDMPPDILSCKGYNVRFWRDEETIRRLAAQDQITQNRDSLGQLLRGFFEYYAYNGNVTSIPGGNVRGFDWGRDALSLRTPRGILPKIEKGWTGAKTVKEVKTVAAPPNSVSSPSSYTPGVNQIQVVHELPTTQEVREIRHRYLFAIEDPFELDHNVARTVTHNGIVAIRDEFRRAWRLIKDSGRIAASATGPPPPVAEELLEDASLVEEQMKKQEFEHLLLEIHGEEVVDDVQGG